jgi:hypothetical protein
VSHFQLYGAMLVVAIIGDLIAQVRSSGGVTQTLQQRGCDAIAMPAHVSVIAVLNLVRSQRPELHLVGRFVQPIVF